MYKYRYTYYIYTSIHTHKYVYISIYTDALNAHANMETRCVFGPSPRTTSSFIHKQQNHMTQLGHSNKPAYAESMPLGP